VREKEKRARREVATRNSEKPAHPEMALAHVNEIDMKRKRGNHVGPLRNPGGSVRKSKIFKSHNGFSNTFYSMKVVLRSEAIHHMHLHLDPTERK